MVRCLVPSLEAVGCDVLTVDLETIKVNNFEYTLLAFINGLEDSLLQHLLTDISCLSAVFFRMFYNPLKNFLTFCTSEMFSEPAILNILDGHIPLHDFSHIFELFQLVSLLLLRPLGGCFYISRVRIEERNNFVFAIVFFDEFFDLGFDAWNLCYFHDSRSIIFFLVKQPFYHVRNI